jgi:hypothetical protein
MFRRCAAPLLHGERRHDPVCEQARLGVNRTHGISRPYMYLKKLCLRKGTCKDRLPVFRSCRRLLVELPPLRFFLRFPPGILVRFVSKRA